MRLEDDQDIQKLSIALHNGHQDIVHIMFIYMYEYHLYSQCQKSAVYVQGAWDFFSFSSSTESRFHYSTIIIYEYETIFCIHNTLLHFTVGYFIITIPFSHNTH